MTAHLSRARYPLGMTVPETPSAHPDQAKAGWPEDSQSSPARDGADPPLTPVPGVRAVDGNRAALALLVIQNLVAAVCMGIDVPYGGRTLHLGFGLSLGASLLVAFAAVVLAAMTLFKPATQALLRDSRWRTRPAWGLALGMFVLAFLASRAFALAYVTLFPDSASTVPQFLSRGPDLAVLLLSAGVLVPLAEEVAFRGLMLRGQERAAGYGVAAVATTVAFAVAHGVPASVAGILPLAYVLARLVQHTGSLWNAVIIHALNNTLSVALGSLLMGQNLESRSQAAELLKNQAVRLPLALGALLFGLVVMFVVHATLVPRTDDPQVRAAPGPWLSGAYVIIVLFGLFTLLMTLPGVQGALSQLQHLRGAVR